MVGRGADSAHGRLILETFETHVVEGFVENAMWCEYAVDLMYPWHGNYTSRVGPSVWKGQLSLAPMPSTGRRGTLDISFQISLEQRRIARVS